MGDFIVCCCILEEGLSSFCLQRKQGFTDSFHSAAPYPNTALNWVEKILCPLRLLAAHTIMHSVRVCACLQKYEGEKFKHLNASKYAN